MHFIYPERYAQHWEMLAEATKANYGPQEDVVIVMGNYLYNDLDQVREAYPNKKIVVYQLEPISENNTHWPPEIITRYLHEADEIWDYDLNNIEYLREKCGITALFRPFIFTERCCKNINSAAEKDIDVLFYGGYTEYRINFVNELQKNIPGKSFVWVNNTQHPTLDTYISRAKVVINIHQFENMPQQEQTRIFYLLSNGKDVVSEKSEYNVYGDLIHEAETPKEMATIIKLLLATYEPLRENHTKYLFKQLKYSEIFDKIVR
jgi:hypothetical protein